MSLPKPFYDEDGITIYHGDCREILPELEPESVTLLWTDPPYGHGNMDGDLQAARVGVRGGRQIPAIPIANDSAEAMRDVVDAALSLAIPILRGDCCCCCCCCGGGPRPTFAWLANRMDTAGLQFFHAVIWDKGGLGMGWRYRRNYEMVMIAHRRGCKLKWETDRKDAITANVVRLAKIIPSFDDHPTPKPVELFDHFLSLHGKPGDVVLDPFMGHSPVGVAALRAGMRYIGIECDAQHFDAAVRRLENANAQQSLFGAVQARPAMTVQEQMFA